MKKKYYDQEGTYEKDVFSSKIDVLFKINLICRDLNALRLPKELFLRQTDEEKIEHTNQI